MTMDNLIAYMFVNSCWLWHKQVIIRLVFKYIVKNLHPGGGGDSHYRYVSW